MTSFKEKIFKSFGRYIDQPKQTDFYDGFYLGASMYSRFSDFDAKGQREVRKTISENAALAKSGNGFAKGFMAGVRKASQARKNGTLYPPRKRK